MGIPLPDTYLSVLVLVYVIRSSALELGEVPRKQSKATPKVHSPLEQFAAWPGGYSAEVEAQMLDDVASHMTGQSARAGRIE